jgi:hypothetical protein
VLFITGYAGTVLPSGFEVIDKPFDLDTLARRAQAVLVGRLQTERDPADLPLPVIQVQC